jgi:hypothetical protein
VFGVIIFAMVAAAGTTTNAKLGCPNKCGDVEISLPFGIIDACHLDESFNITCNSGIPMTGNLPVTNISIEIHELHILNFVARDCYNRSGQLESNNFPTTKISSLFLTVTLMRTFVGPKMEKIIGLGAHLYVLAFSMGLALALVVAR